MDYAEQISVQNNMNISQTSFGPISTIDDNRELITIQKWIQVKETESLKCSTIVHQTGRHWGDDQIGERAYKKEEWWGKLK